MTRTIEMRTGAHQVRIVARDVRSGATGSVIVPASDILARMTGGGRLDSEF